MAPRCGAIDITPTGVVVLQCLGASMPALAPHRQLLWLFKAGRCKVGWGLMPWGESIGARRSSPSGGQNARQHCQRRAEQRHELKQSPRAGHAQSQGACNRDDVPVRLAPVRANAIVSYSQCCGVVGVQSCCHIALAARAGAWVRRHNVRDPAWAPKRRQKAASPPPPRGQATQTH